jgi:signal transduction histidine kinase
MTSMRIIQNGDYSHKVNMGGNDELTVLGNEFNDLTERLHTSEQKRRRFVSDASHELKTPLASIKLLTDSILQNDMDRDTMHEFVGDIGNEAERLNRMSQKLLSLSRIETQEDGDCEIVYLKPTLDRVTRMLSGIAESGNIDLVCSIVEDSPILILEDDLYQIAFNLAENGIKYNTPGGTLRIALHREADNAVLKISDTGMGIPEDSLPHIFERFYRVDKARSRKSGGSGLGLAIVKNLVERNGGTISVTSRPGEGTEFTVEFPIFDIEEEEK